MTHSADSIMCVNDECAYLVVIYWMFVIIITMHYPIDYSWYNCSWTMTKITDIRDTVLGDQSRIYNKLKRCNSQFRRILDETFEQLQGRKELLLVFYYSLSKLIAALLLFGGDYTMVHLTLCSERGSDLDRCEKGGRYNKSINVAKHFLLPIKHFFTRTKLE